MALLIAPDGTNLGEHSLEEAEKVASVYELDLIEVRPGVYKILDMGKLQYEASKRKIQKSKSIKEMKFTLNIGNHDYETKMRKVLDFLKAGHSVRIAIWFSGREVSRPEVGIAMMQKIQETVDSFGVCSINSELQGKNMYMSIEPKK